MTPTTAAALASVAAVFGVDAETVLGRSRLRPHAYARFAAMRLLRDAGWTLPQIGRALGGRDHTTILSGLRRAATLSAAWQEKLAAAQALFEAGRPRSPGEAGAAAAAAQAGAP